MKQLREALGIASDIDSPEQLAFIAAQNASMATRLEWSFNDVVFRAASSLPSVIMFAAITYRFTPASLLTSAVVGVMIFGLSAAYSIQMLALWRDHAESLIVYSKTTFPTGPTETASVVPATQSQEMLPRLRTSEAEPATKVTTPNPPAG